IWMRRSVPQKRSYQILLAVDDSKSMAEKGSGTEALAFETLAMVAKSLTMLEAGELCIVSFGENVAVAHAFGEPFSVEAGVKVFQHFTFQQEKTNILALVREALQLFRNARQSNLSGNAQDIWQLGMIISDGVCEDHDAIRLLLRQAMQERIMFVFIIVDSVNRDGGGSIVDMQEAVFEAEPATRSGALVGPVGEAGDIGAVKGAGEKKLRIRRYLDNFPFQYYVVVGDVRELPGVLAQALRGWFGEVVEGG
ncbi:MAG: hypothetical protein Q9201_007721, partial [Fulgogasparrea decipioides]